MKKTTIKSKNRDDNRFSQIIQVWHLSNNSKDVALRGKTSFSGGHVE